LISAAHLPSSAPVSCIFFRRAGDWITAVRNNPFCRFFGFYHRAKLPVEPLDDGARRSSRRRQSIIKRRLETRQPGLGGRRNIGKGGGAGLTSHRYGVHISRLDVAARRRYRIESKRHVATDEIIGEWPRAFVQHDRDLGTGHRLEWLWGKIVDGRGGRRARRELTGLLFR